MKYLHGTIIIAPNGHITITNGVYDCEGGPPPNSQLEMAQAAFNLVLERFLSQKGIVLPERFQSSASEKPSAPISLQLEREAEMEAYLLINRIQGNS